MLATSQIVHQHPFFANLPESYSQALLENSSQRIFETNKYLTRQGQPANEFYLLGNGKVSIETVTETNEVVSVQQVGEGEILGLSWLFPPYLWQFDAKAIETTRSLVFDARVLRSMCEQDHEFAFQLMRRYGQLLFERVGSIRQSLIAQHVSTESQSVKHRNQKQKQR